MRHILLILMCLHGTDALAQKKPTSPEVIDGDTIISDGSHIRLWGIDAPELNQTCDSDAKPLGVAARDHLAYLISKRPVQCKLRSVDRYGRYIMICRNVAGTDLSKQMVDDGYAWAYEAFTADYVDNERVARLNKLGVHAHNCELPWVWRRQQQRDKPTPLQR